MKINILIAIVIAFLCSNCATIQTENIKYNEGKQIYEYQLDKRNTVVLRNANQQLVDSLNFEQFKTELAKIKNRYPFRKRIENDILLKNSDLELSVLYSRINQEILNTDFQQAIKSINTISRIYPDVYKYSDCYYLKGYAFEKLGLADSAKVSYDKFMRFSGQKYSSRFRGYRDFDMNDSIFISERRYVESYLLNRNQETVVKINAMKPKYYYASFLPGYNLNSEDIAKHSLGVFMFSIGTNFSKVISMGGQFYYKINDRFNINPKFSFTGNVQEFTLAAPIQIYKSDNNNFGLKFTPFLNYINIDSVNLDGDNYKFNESVFNFGGRISIGFYPVQHLAFGAYYQYNFHNQNNKIVNNESQIEVWLNNEYDLSLYYNIYKNFSLKVGIKNSDLVAGLFWSGWEFSYDITTPGLILRIDMY